MSSVREIFDTMAYGPAPESNAEALDWLARHDHRFGHFIDGGFTAPEALFDSKNPATGKGLAQVSQGSAASVDRAVAAARNISMPSPG